MEHIALNISNYDAYINIGKVVNCNQVYDSFTFQQYSDCDIHVDRELSATCTLRFLET